MNGELERITKQGRIVGFLFLMGFLGIPSSVIIEPLFKNPDLLLNIPVHKTYLILGSLLQISMGFACAGIVIWMYPALKKYDEPLAMGAVGFRLIEAIFHVAGGVTLALVIPFHQVISLAPAIDQSTTQMIQGFLKSTSEWFRDAAATPSWLLGATIYYYVFFKTKLVPTWLSLWGLAGALLALVATVLFLLGIIKPFSVFQVFMMAPIAMQELILAFWLMLKGFNINFLKTGE